jgi:ubiquinone/menaquinone biosynthesis C-methylase UbiE
LETEVKEAILVSAATGRWYPVRGYIPEMLPDALRNLRFDFEWLTSWREKLPGDLYDSLVRPDLFQSWEDDSGIRFKLAELSLQDKKESDFYAPGYIAPYNPEVRGHNIYLIKLFAMAAEYLYREGRGKTVLDTGSGYSWTTDWLMRMGFEAIGSDLVRRYLDIARARLGSDSPHLVVADTEHLPFLTNSLDSVLGYESFHHLPERHKTMREFYRILRGGGRVVLAEPGGAHEASPGSQEAMQQLGTLERGMELEDVREYVRGIGFDEPIQHWILDHAETIHQRRETPAITREFLAARNTLPSHIFTIDRP